MSKAKLLIPIKKVNESIFTIYLFYVPLMQLKNWNDKRFHLIT